MKRLVLVTVAVDQTFDEFVGYPLITTGTPEGQHVKLGLWRLRGSGPKDDRPEEEVQGIVCMGLAVVILSAMADGAHLGLGWFYPCSLVALHRRQVSLERR